MTTLRKTRTPVSIAYEVHGPADGEPILFLNGLGLQLTQWPKAMLEHLHAEGYRTILMDNRDIGLSDQVQTGRVPNVYLHLVFSTFGIRTGAPYRLEDMADDAAAVLNDLGIDKAHILGLSMGGIIAQVFGATHPERTKSLILLMTTTNNRRLPRPKGEAAKVLFDRRPPPTTMDDAVQRQFEKWAFFRTQEGGQTDEELREWLRQALERGTTPDGWLRQVAAIIEGGDIRHYSRKVEAPCFIVHGSADRLVPIVGGKDIAANIRGAKMKTIEGMGHDLPPRHLDEINRSITHFLQSAAR
ncbi:MAG: alpha/beta hydrolase [Parvularcula sp.]|jgi:pimeloyl-ACP methyl ester carboxylesterase|nr:alpha/beta hydrolase [Parvularcula sp.]